jgi:hypothetical protein
MLRAAEERLRHRSDLIQAENQRRCSCRPQSFHPAKKPFPLRQGAALQSCGKKGFRPGRVDVAESGNSALNIGFAHVPMGHETYHARRYRRGQHAVAGEDIGPPPSACAGLADVDHHDIRRNFAGIDQ